MAVANCFLAEQRRHRLRQETLPGRVSKQLVKYGTKQHLGLKLSGPVRFANDGRKALTESAQRDGENAPNEASENTGGRDGGKRYNRHIPNAFTNLA